MSDKWAHTKQRDDLPPCPFCGTAPIHQMRLADSSTDMQHQNQCGNPFCAMVVKTNICASQHDADEAWRERT